MRLPEQPAARAMVESDVLAALACEPLCRAGLGQVVLGVVVRCRTPLELGKRERPSVVNGRLRESRSSPIRDAMRARCPPISTRAS